MTGQRASVTGGARASGLQRKRQCVDSGAMVPAAEVDAHPGANGQECFKATAAHSVVAVSEATWAPWCALGERGPGERGPDDRPGRAVLRRLGCKDEGERSASAAARVAG